MKLFHDAFGYFFIVFERKYTRKACGSSYGILIEMREDLQELWAAENESFSTEEEAIQWLKIYHSPMTPVDLTMGRDQIREVNL